ncbi:TIGR02757 family protein [Dyadobacter sp. LHD-138]|uniref:TIGR02757 family protein n=1 Tax=Dyadobacter sp. LHD-138 TaxID=3071413 RepID=UPI0027E0AAE8|nr:TIGR02757 family protein [Dyadobacter sp. LHD-138]MDQ6480810.1 TIGR02757 family protein [Dyadobacter sp. LHD-138]
MRNIEVELRPISQAITDLLEAKAEQYNQPDFIPYDPISIPHRFSKKQDIEIMGFWAAVLAWGQRKTIINKCLELSSLMDDAPYDFVKNHQESDLKKFLGFKHRTFNATDTLYFLHFFQNFYNQHDSLEYAFSSHMSVSDVTIENGLIGFYDLFSDSENFPGRTKKHIATPVRKSSCKRLNMFLRWMVRKDNKGVDFGIWENISPSQLVCPCDVHVDRIGRKLGLIQRPVTDWKTATELTASLRMLNPNDPVLYDFALFGLGIEGFAKEEFLI